MGSSSSPSTAEHAKSRRKGERYDPLDRRQRLAATILMGGVDLPQPLPQYAKLTLAAARLTPGCFVNEAMLGSGRIAALKRARELIDEMLSEDGSVPSLEAPVVVARLRRALEDTLYALESFAGDIGTDLKGPCPAEVLCGEPICASSGCIVERVARARAALAHALPSQPQDQ